MTPLVHLRRWLARLRWHHDTDTLPPRLAWLVRHRHEAAALVSLALFGFVCSVLATAVAIADTQAFTGWTLLGLLLLAAAAASFVGHLLIEAATMLGAWIVGMLRRRRAA